MSLPQPHVPLHILIWDPNATAASEFAGDFEGISSAGKVYTPHSLDESLEVIRGEKINVIFIEPLIANTSGELIIDPSVVKFVQDVRKRFHKKVKFIFHTRWLTAERQLRLYFRELGEPYPFESFFRLDKDLTYAAFKTDLHLILEKCERDLRTLVTTSTQPAANSPLPVPPTAPLKRFHESAPLASWIFGGLILVFLMVVVFIPIEPDKYPIIRFLMALSAAFFAFFFVGGVLLESTYKGLFISGTGGFALFILIQIFFDPFALVYNGSDRRPKVVGSPTATATATATPTATPIQKVNSIEPMTSPAGLQQPSPTPLVSITPHKTSLPAGVKKVGEYFTPTNFSTTLTASGEQRKLQNLLDSDPGAKVYFVYHQVEDEPTSGEEPMTDELRVEHLQRVIDREFRKYLPNRFFIINGGPWDRRIDIELYILPTPNRGSNSK